MTDWNLSDKEKRLVETAMVIPIPQSLAVGEYVIKSEDVKEFIKRLRNYCIGKGVSITSYEDWTAVPQKELIEFIDKLAGDKLI